MTPVDTEAPCGPDLEYDPEFVVLSASVVTRPEAQYGDFVGMPEPVNWGEVERDCRRLMMRSKDMRLAVLFCRCRTRLAGPIGLAEGLGLLAAWLAAFPDSIHPQLAVDADRDAALEIRMNALQTLTDAEGLLADLREFPLTRTSATRLQVRDVERAFAQPRASDALAPESAARQLEDLRVQQPTVMDAIAAALASVAAIDAWAQELLGEYAPDLSMLIRLLRLFPVTASSNRAAPESDLTYTPAPDGTQRSVVTSEPVDTARVEPELKPADDCAGSIAHQSCESRVDKGLANRNAALELVRTARQWFETHEPSSPIPVLLKRAETLVGKRYSETVNAIPAELLAEWDKE
ncbi:type VI secretion system protein TssA [Paraburkholderia fungorum]|uniref:type VI secretion system protein TssA n=1 Tax=Paraburkholderia fungorum TaxID=134537 RepID=UPI0038BBC2E0